MPALPEYLMQCNLLPDSDDPDACVGNKEVKEARIRAQKPCKVPQVLYFYTYKLRKTYNYLLGFSFFFFCFRFSNEQPVLKMAFYVMQQDAYL